MDHDDSVTTSSDQEIRDLSGETWSKEGGYWILNFNEIKVDLNLPGGTGWHFDGQRDWKIRMGNHVREVGDSMYRLLSKCQDLGIRLPVLPPAWVEAVGGAPEACGVEVKAPKPDPVRLSHRIRLLSHEALDADNDDLAVKLRDLAAKAAEEGL